MSNFIELGKLQKGARRIFQKIQMDKLYFLWQHHGNTTSHVISMHFPY